MNNRKIKKITFITLVTFFILLIIYSIFGSSMSFSSVENIKKSRILKEDLISSLKINNREAFYDKNSNTYFYTVSDRYENKKYALNLQLEKGYKYKIIDKIINVINVNYDDYIDIIIYNDKYYYNTKIKLTNVPIIKITTNDEISREDTKSEFTYINSNSKNNKVYSNAMIHIRGASSASFDKKSYKLEMYDNKFMDEKATIISDFYYGSDFILDAVYRDPSKIRNLLSIQLWNDISSDFTNVRVYSEFVELFINNEYRGLYILTEPINRKKLGLDKSKNDNTSVLIKSNDWKIVDNNKNFENISDANYMGLEIKYPNDSKYFQVIWQKFIDKIYDYYSPDTEVTYSVINNAFNLNNYIDLIIFNAFINNSDGNMVKNNYFYMEDLDSNEIFIQPWDMEYSFGLEYLDDINKNLIKKVPSDSNEILTTFKHPHAENINELLIDRYWSLRKNIITEKYFDDILDNYLHELNKGVAKRDSKIWYEYDIEKEIEEVRIWIHKRIKYFDEYVSDLENE